MALYDLLPINVPYVWLSLGLIVLTPLLTLLYDISLWRRMPPGPRPLPFVGNKPHLPKSQPWHQFQAWSKIYGPIFTIWIGRRPTVVISDPHVAVELMEKRSTKYSSRPRMVAMGEILWEGASLLVQPYGKAWSIRRKMLHQAMTPKALRGYKPVQEAEASRLCWQLVQDPQNFEKLLERFTASIVFSVAYGHRIDSLNAEVVRQRFEFMQYSSGLNVPGKYLVETFPFLKYVPNIFAPWKRDIQDHGRREAAANMALVNVVRQDMAQAAAVGKPDSVPPSLCAQLLAQRVAHPETQPVSDRDFSYIPASLFGAGSDTTASTLCTAILALVTHPSAQHAAHAELDAVIGSSRTPGFADEPILPYLRALVKEVLRWRPVAVLGGTPHATSADDWYMGYYIPAGTTVLGNSWTINHHEAYYPDPHRFDPARFLDAVLAEKAADPPGAEARGLGKAHPAKTAGHSSFGWGRRVCPGAELASNSLFAALAKMLWAFEVLPVEGKRYDTFAYRGGFNIRPERFEVVIRVRSEERRRVLEREDAEAMGVLGRFTAFRE